jgi:hypothetical protein
MRRVQDAVYWLVYLDGFPPSEKLTRKAARFRVARRILIGAAEDALVTALHTSRNIPFGFKFSQCIDISLITYGEDWVNVSSSCRVTSPTFVHLAQPKYMSVVVWRHDNRKRDR